MRIHTHTRNVYHSHKYIYIYTNIIYICIYNRIVYNMYSIYYVQSNIAVWLPVCIVRVRAFRSILQLYRGEREGGHYDTLDFNDMSNRVSLKLFCENWYDWFSSSRHAAGFFKNYITTLIID